VNLVYYLFNQCDMPKIIGRDVAWPLSLGHAEVHSGAIAMSLAQQAGHWHAPGQLIPPRILLTFCPLSPLPWLPDALSLARRMINSTGRG
jgi:hypothetical protein